MHLNHIPTNFVTRTGRKVSQTSPWKVTLAGTLVLVAYLGSLLGFAYLLLGDK